MASLPAPLDALRRTVAGDVRELLAADPMPAAWFRRTPEDPGLFDRDSVVWRVHANRAGLIGGLRALLLQTMHPLAMAGVAQHSDYRHDPWGRLHRTGSFIAVTTYGTTSAAEAAIAAVRRIHDRVTGVADDGRAYHANDPHLLAWVHDTEVDSFLRAYQRYGGPLSAPEADRYIAEMAEVGRRLGVTDPPLKRVELREALRAYRPELRATPLAREAVRFLLWPPLPAYLRPAYGMFAAASVGLLPAFVRRELWLPTAPLSDPLLVQPSVRVLLKALGSALGSEPPAARTARREGSGRSAASGLNPTGGSPSASARRSPPAGPGPRDHRSPSAGRATRRPVGAGSPDGGDRNANRTRPPRSSQPPVERSAPPTSARAGKRATGSPKPVGTAPPPRSAAPRTAPADRPRARRG
jgi:uncharacterized protein (DUF2236 family)